MVYWFTICNMIRCSSHLKFALLAEQFLSKSPNYFLMDSEHLFWKISSHVWPSGSCDYPWNSYSTWRGCYSWRRTDLTIWKAERCDCCSQNRKGRARAFWPDSCEASLGINSEVIRWKTAILMREGVAE